MDQQALALIHRVPGMTQATLWKLQKAFPTREDFLRSNETELRSILKNEDLAAGVNRYRMAFDTTRMELQYKKLNITYLGMEDDRYPRRLKEIDDPPVLLYVRGNVDLLNEPAVAMVGSRKASTDGLRRTALFAEMLAEEGFVIISGMALGVDAAAHEGALRARGRTIAVLGGGVDHIYPKENRTIYESILNQGGAIVSETAPGMKPAPWSFPARNRIISGLSMGVMIAEAGEKSGSLITARRAVDQNRNLYVLKPLTGGLNAGLSALLGEGAEEVSDPRVIARELGLQVEKREHRNQNAAEELTGLAAAVIEALTGGPKHLLELPDDGDLFEVLLDLELSGRIVKRPGNFYERKI